MYTSVLPRFDREQRPPRGCTSGRAPLCVSGPKFDSMMTCKDFGFWGLGAIFDKRLTPCLVAHEFATEVDKLEELSRQNAPIVLRLQNAPASSALLLLCLARN
mmetsp:Transcript_4024/g.7214  ORF Transcript_4024/g.7214 Transcript_4024/m.7214 type:complete len:103 (-) Transcript_4024:501-809(-)